jgi:Flp pilus assembly pilin Flp
MNFKQQLNRFLKEEDGMNTVEIVIILAIVIGIALLFKTRLTGFANNIMDAIFQPKIANDFISGVK